MNEKFLDTFAHGASGARFFRAAEEGLAAEVKASMLLP
jgi:hypothetical protein